jgi:hypothetical protein
MKKIIGFSLFTMLAFLSLALQGIQAQDLNMRYITPSATYSIYDGKLVRFQNGSSDEANLSSSQLEAIATVIRQSGFLTLDKENGTGDLRYLIYAQLGNSSTADNSNAVTYRTQGGFNPPAAFAQVAAHLDALIADVF